MNSTNERGEAQCSLQRTARVVGVGFHAEHVRTQAGDKSI